MYRGSLLNKFNDKVEELIERLVENDSHHLSLMTSPFSTQKEEF